MIRVIELGPFGSRIDRGVINDLDELPEGYLVREIDEKDDLSSVYIEPQHKQNL